jgi:alcohol dehydrogenase (cytochrome c)
MKQLFASVISVSALALNTAAFANESVMKGTHDPKQWVMQAGSYDNQRYSKLDQINETNVG